MDTKTHENDDGVLYREESYAIVGAAIKVWKELGYGFLEKVYENSLAFELREAKFDVEQQFPIPVFYLGHQVGDYYADILVNGVILLELKTARAIDDIHIAQTLNYLKATNLRLGIILNFGPIQLSHKRLVR